MRDKASFVQKILEAVQLEGLLLSMLQGVGTQITLVRGCGMSFGTHSDMSQKIFLVRYSQGFQ